MGQEDHHEPHQRWYKLDNAGNLYSALISSRTSTVFRLTVGVDHQVDPQCLQAALDIAIQRFPYFQVNLKRGLFWYYYEHTDKRPLVERESHYPCKTIRQTSGVFPFRVLYYNSYVHLEISHSVADGFGGIQLLRCIIIEYFRLKDAIVSTELDKYGIIDLDSPVDAEEYEDAFARYYEPQMPPPPKSEPAYHLPFPLLDKGQYLLVTGISPVKPLLKLAREAKCTLTQYITALYFESLQEYALSHVKRRKNGYGKGRIAINIPIDLRKFYPTKSLRNFFVSLNPAIDLSLGEYSREELISFVRDYMGLYINEKNIKRYISRNVRNEEFVFLRVIPLWFKRLIMPIIYNIYGERGYTSSVSNLGRITFPAEIADRVTLFEGFPAPSGGNALKIVMASYADKLYISFGKTTAETAVEKIFFSKIRALGVPVKIEGNQLNTY